MVSFNRILRSVAIAAAFVAVTNCSESATSPTSAPFRSPSFDIGGGNSLAAHFAAKPNSANFSMSGVIGITISSNSICNLATSSYGPGTWDSPCGLATDSVVISSAISTTASGHPRVDFYPAMRFAPGTQDVILTIADSAAAANPNSVILYCNDSNVCVDEGLTDPSLRTYHDPVRGIVWRKIKHFSGYTVSSCDPSDPTYDPNACQS